MIEINDLKGLQIPSPGHPCICMSSTGTCIATEKNSWRGFSFAGQPHPNLSCSRSWSVSSLLTACKQLETSGPVVASVLLQGAREVQLERQTCVMQAQNPHTGIRINISVHADFGVHGQQVVKARLYTTESGLSVEPHTVNSLRLPHLHC